MEVTILEELEHDDMMTAWLLKIEDGRYAVMSSIKLNERGNPEVLIFPSCEHGSHGPTEVAGGESITIEDALEDLKGVLDGKPRRYRRPGFIGDMIAEVEETGTASFQTTCKVLHWFAAEVLPVMALQMEHGETRDKLSETSEAIQKFVDLAMEQDRLGIRPTKEIIAKAQHLMDDLDRLRREILG